MAFPCLLALLEIANFIVRYRSFIIFGLWEIATVAFKVPRWIIPGPIAIFTAMVEGFSDIAPHLLISLETIFVGFIIAVPLGIILAALITNFKLLSVALDPYIIFLVVTPLITCSS